MVNDRIFNNVSEVAEAQTLVIKADVAKAVFIPHFHPVIAAGAAGDNCWPDVKLAQELLAGGVNRGDPQRRPRIGAQRLWLSLLKDGDAQPAALQSAGNRQPHHATAHNGNINTLHVQLLNGGPNRGYAAPAHRAPE